MKIMLFVCGEGLGHTSRCIPLAQQIQAAGHDVMIGAYGYSRELIEKKGLQTIEIPPEIQLVGDAGSLDLKRSVLATIKSGQLLGIRKVSRQLKEFKPQVVISDSYYTATLAAMFKKIPVHLMINQSNMEEFFYDKGSFMKLIGKVTKRFYNAIFRKVDGIIIPDYPMPDTICRLNLDLEDEKEDNVFYSGPLVGKKYEEVIEADLSRPHVLSTVGGFGYREPIFRKVIETARLDTTISYTLLSGPSVDPDDFTDLPENVTILRFIEDQFPYIKSSDLVIAPGGHSTMMEALSFGIPMLSFPDIGHNEQENNANALEEDGCGRKLNYSTSPAQLLEYIHEITNDGKLLEKSRELHDLSNELDGPSAITRMMELKYMK
ncbi:UDP-N-acetylglucosamine--N-acetylmuramyl-(pentapeptide) pyrophosphoryl-undecaprenol N-acetylglucosamine transferase [Methanococcoides sp. AM1]|uniref:UDP-N-acetylglucosamine--N-acetylmuramyl- (pentapeptide) pyrophosphoryl-undecaprenol N-acetylglucosamine transferase n=1 Tax=Methanococcoides sp. AM1 TaxID=1201011 RepID=UPI0010832D61|nr:glycosyltransferase [Methanococcoides sp. AM1]